MVRVKSSNMSTPRTSRSKNSYAENKPPNNQVQLVTSEPNQRHQLLLVEDDLDLASMVRDYLTTEGYDVATEENGTVAAARIVAESYDAVILDIGLPGMNGIDVCRTIRDEFAGPIIMLTARGDEIDEVLALDVGADDYINKPVRPRALLARLRSHLRRADQTVSTDSQSLIQVNGMSINASSRRVVVDGKTVELSTAEFDLLWILARQSGTVVPRNEIYEEIQGIKYDGLDRSIDLRVSRLRRKIGDSSHFPTRIKSVRGVGYLLATES